MCRTILVPLDGSPVAEQALPLALAIADRAGAAVRLVRAHVKYFFKDRACAWVPRFDPHLEAQCLAEDQDYLDGVAQRHGAAWSTPLTGIVLHGEPADAILNEAQTSHRPAADLIVMATSAHSVVDRFFEGSVSDAIVRRAPVPVLLVPAHEPGPARNEGRTPHHMLIALDGSPFAETVLEPALEVGRHLNVRCSLLQVLTPALHSGQVQQYLESVAERLRHRAMPVQTRVASGRVAAAILAEAARHDVDLIALATHGHGGFKRICWGSVADQLHRKSPIPVLVCRGCADRHPAAMTG